MSDDSWLRTGIGASDIDSITLMGRDLASELMGKVTLTELSFLMVRKRMPSEQETRLLDAVLVSLADHGLTPTVLAARLTHTGAPESIQGAIAAGLLGAGSVFLGVVEDTARFLDEIIDSGEPFERAVADRIAAGERIPGLGHPIHKLEDPRTPRIYAIAEEAGQLGPHLRMLQLVSDAHSEQTGRRLPINGPAWRAPRWRTSASPRSCCAALRCWPAPPVCSGTWPRRPSTRLACGSTARSTSVRSTNRPRATANRSRSDNSWANHTLPLRPGS
jgi:citrate synthase